MTRCEELWIPLTLGPCGAQVDQAVKQLVTLVAGGTATASVAMGRKVIPCRMLLHVLPLMSNP